MLLGLDLKNMFLPSYTEQIFSNCYSSRCAMKLSQMINFVFMKSYNPEKRLILANYLIMYLEQ